MSATPNPKRKAQRSFSGFVKMYRLTRDEQDNVWTANGYIAKADYESLRQRRPELDFPAFDSIPKASSTS